MEVTISVRGEARELVGPDRAALSCSVSRVAADKGAALRDLAVAVERITTALAEQGAVALDPEHARAPVTWSLRWTSSDPEHAHDERTGGWGPTGRVTAQGQLEVAVRDLAQLDRLGSLLARFEAVHVQGVQWLVDDDNPAWARVRAEAVRAAVLRARDYAAALGGTLVALAQVADVGLLAAGDGGHAVAVAGGWFAQSRASGGAPESPSLDPVPQDVSAQVDARFTAAGLSLP